jgi:small subunit ribosomal protein S16
LAVRIRLTRVGATKRPAYRVIAIDKRRSRDGRALEILGYYDPLTEPATVQLDREKIQAWIGKGAQPSDTVVKLMRQAERVTATPEAAEKPKRATRSATKPSKKASAKAAAAAPTADEGAAPAESATEAEPAADADTAPAPAADAGKADA